MTTAVASTTPRAQGAAGQTRWLVEALMFLTYAAFGLSWVATTPLMADLKVAYALTDAQLGLLSTAVSIGKVVAPLMTAWLALRVGVARAIGIGSILICVCALTPFTTNFQGFLATRFVFGLGGAMVVTLLSPMVMQWFGQAERALVNSLNNVAVNTGITVTLFATVPVSGMLGWRRTLMVYAAISLALCMLWWLFGKDAPTEEASSMATGAEQADASASGYAEVWKRTETWLVALAFAGPLALYLSLNTWLPRHLMETAHLAKATASQYTGLFNLVGIPTALVMGILVQRAGLRRPFIIGAGVVMGLSALGLVFGGGPVFWWPAAILLGISFFTYTGPLFTLPMELEGFTPRHVTLLMGTVFSFAYTVSSFAPVAVGYLRDLTGSFLPGLGMWCIFSFVLAGAGTLLPETGPRARRS
ncbi:MAG: MFS transporter [Candidatus Sericytochromatia bacterium]|nr:MFS transporter [Candidatus Tanganyikabacteria bacterium]